MSDPPEPTPPSRADRVRAAVTTWTRQLADLGGPNTLLWYRDQPTGTLDLATAHPGGVAMLMSGRATRLTSLLRTDSALAEGRRRVRAIADAARELREERGVETAFVAFGVASWTLPGASGGSRMPCAPVLLRSVTLHPAGPDGSDIRFDLDERIELNPVLVHYLRTEAKLSVDVRGIEALASGTAGFNPYPAYAALEEACSGLPDFHVAPRIVLSTFPYFKLPMVADLANESHQLAGHDVIAALVGDPRAARAIGVTSERAGLGEPPATPDPMAPTDLPAPSGPPAKATGRPGPTPGSATPPAGARRGAHPAWFTSGPEAAGEARLALDADSAQIEVVEAVRAGAHLAVQAPPGTGATQTIANLVAVLAAEGKQVLLVAQQRSAITDVIDRLDGIGLADLVLDLPEGARGRPRVIRELARTLDLAAGRTEPVDTGRATRLRELRERRSRALAVLEGHTSATHETREPFGVSAAEAMERVSALARIDDPPRTRVRFTGATLAGLDRASHDAHTAQLVRLADLGAWITTDDEDSPDPWFGARIATTDDVTAATDRLARVAHGGVEAVGATIAQALAGLTLGPAPTVRHWGETLTTLDAVRATFETFRPEIFDEPLEPALSATARRGAVANRPGWWERQRIKAGVRRLLRPGRPPADMHAALAAAAAQRDAWRSLAGPGGRPEIPAELDGALAVYRSLEADLTWLDERLPHAPGEPGLLDLDRPALVQRLDLLAEHPDRLRVLPDVRGPLDALAAAGLGPLVDDLARRGVPAAAVTAECDLAWWASVLTDIAERDPRIGEQSGDELRAAATEFAEADAQIIGEGAGATRDAVHERVTEMMRLHPDQASLIRMMTEPGRAMPLRAILDSAGDLALAVRPCWAMSPFVVGSALPAGRRFDVAVIADAGQLPTAATVSAMARATQVVLVGDSRLLPPTGFVTTAPATAVETSDERDQSVLEALADVLPARTLTRQHRCHDARLVAFPNEHVYDGTIRALPGTSADPVVALELVDGIGVPPEGGGAVASTAAEVSRVVELVLAHARTHPRESLGVVTLTAMHAERITEALRRARSTLDAETESLLDTQTGGRLRVTSVGHADGDVRDGVILSLGYGKTPHGRVLHRFGLLDSDAGCGGLTVALTRARNRLTIVSSLTAEDLDPARLRTPGTRMLRELLAWAEQPGPGVAASEMVQAASETGETASGTGVAESGLVGELAQRLRAEGLVVHESYGGPLDGVELAVESRTVTGRLVVAVDTDGSRYATQPSGRDRDRLRGDELRRLGWRPLRIFLRDLYRDPAREVHRVCAVLDGAPEAAASAGPEEAASAAVADPPS